MSKEAVVFLLDAHPSMNAPYPVGSPNNSTRLSCAKDALEGMVSQLMIQSKQNEVGVLVLNTPGVKAEAEDNYMAHRPEQYPHITELTLPSVTRPSVDLLQAIRRVQCASHTYSGADVCDGMVLAEHVLRRRTFKKKFARRLVIFTDAAHKLESSNETLLQAIDNLRELECTLTVIGVDFEHSALFEAPLAADQAVKQNDSGEDNDGEDNQSDDGSETTVGEEEDDDNGHQSEEGEEDVLAIKRANEQLLTSVARLTGGSILAASDMRDISEQTLGKRVPKSIKKKIDFQIAPGLKFEARLSLLLSKASFPSLKTEAVQVEAESGETKKDGLGEVMTSEIVKTTDFWEGDQEVSREDLASAYRFGSDYVPISSLDELGLKLFLGDPSIRILGYTSQDVVSRSNRIGPPYALTGGKSHRVCCAIAALAQALHREKKVAICTQVKTRHADPTLGALFPLEEENKSLPTRLVFLQIPFANDIRSFVMKPLEAASKDCPEARSSDDLIDSFMLPSDALKSQEVANPAIRAFRKTIKNRAVDDSCNEIVSTRSATDSMTTPSEMVEKAASSLRAFRQAFPLEKVEEPEGKAKKKPKYWTDKDP